MTGNNSGIISLTPAADYKDKKGYTVNMAGDVATVSASATVESVGVIVEGNETAAGYASERVSVALFGATPGAEYMRCSGAITKGARVQQAADGTIVTEGAGARVVLGVALQTGAAGENILVAIRTPQVYAS